MDEVDHSISVSTGPSYQSQRDAVNDFLDNLIGQLPKLPVAPPQAAQILSIAVKMKDLEAHLGDELAEDHQAQPARTASRARSNCSRPKVSCSSRAS